MFRLYVARWEAGSGAGGGKKWKERAGGEGKGGRKGMGRRGNEGGICGKTKIKPQLKSSR
jgi:hypothetical protein